MGSVDDRTTRPGPVDLVRIGVNLGDSGKATTICTVALRNLGTEMDPLTHYYVMHIETMPAATRYEDVALRVKEISRRAAERSDCYPWIYIDATGLGDPVIRTFRRAQIQGMVIGVYLDGREFRDIAKDEWEIEDVKLGKGWMVSQLKTILEERRLHITGNHELSQTLAREFVHFQIWGRSKERDPDVPFSVGRHDDLITAVGLAVQDEIVYEEEPMVF